jgi:hypothetical protein
LSEGTSQFVANSSHANYGMAFFLEFAMKLLTEQKLSLTELARREGVSICTTWRWASRGVRGIRLETFNIGGRRWTTDEAFARFVAGTTAAAGGDANHSAARTNRQREAAIARAEQELSDAGI